MQNIPAGLVAGFIATVVLSAMVVVKGMMGLMLELNSAAMIGNMVGASALVGWTVHFMIGTIASRDGVSQIYGLIPGGNAVVKSIDFSVVAT
jgi:hypothetical protein